ncbi:MAG: ABC transporter transmembrane domain-containing protein [Oscillospiraceae bacterium]
MVNNRITFCVMRDTRREAFAKLQKLPLSYLDAHPSGDVVSRMIADVDQFADGLLMGFTQLFTGVVTILGTLGFMFDLNWKIALVVVVLTPLSLFAAKFIASRTYSMFREQSHHARRADGAYRRDGSTTEGRAGVLLRAARRGALRRAERGAA